MDFAIIAFDAIQLLLEGGLESRKRSSAQRNRGIYGPWRLIPGGRFSFGILTLYRDGRFDGIQRLVAYPPQTVNGTFENSVERVLVRNKQRSAVVVHLTFTHTDGARVEPAMRRRLVLNPITSVFTDSLGTRYRRV